MRTVLGVQSTPCNVSTVKCNSNSIRMGMGALMTTATALMMTLPAHAEKIADFEGSGFLFKDQVNRYEVYLTHRVLARGAAREGGIYLA